MNDVIRVLKSRRSVRKYKPDMISKSNIDEIISCGLYAASGMGRQDPIILAVTDKKLRDRLSEMNAKIMGAEGTDPFYGAPVVLVVLVPEDVPTGIYDGSLVMGNMMAAAESMGLGSCWIHRAKEEFASEEGKQILKDLGIEGTWEGIGHLILGYPDGKRSDPAPRKKGRVFYAE